MRETERETETDRQTDRQTETETERVTDRDREPETTLPYRVALARVSVVCFHVD